MSNLDLSYMLKLQPHEDFPAAPMDDVLQHFANEIGRTIAAKQDDLIRRCITRRLGTSEWTLEEILPRLKIEIDKNKPEKMFTLDGKPLISIWPPDHAQETAMWPPEATSTMYWKIYYREHP